MIDGSPSSAADAFCAALGAAAAALPTLPPPPYRVGGGRLLGAATGPHGPFPAPVPGDVPRRGRVSDTRAQPFRDPKASRKVDATPATVEAAVQNIEARRRVPGENALRLRRLRAVASELHPWDASRNAASRVFQCGSVVVGGGANGGDAYIGEGKGGTHAVFGTQSCGLVWECACCRARAGAEHLEEIRTVTGYWLAKERPQNRAYFVTLTTRHEAGDDVETMRRGLAAAWGAFVEGRAWQRFKEANGAHYVRALDVTLGRSGFHLHFHVLLFTTSALDTHKVKAELAERWRRVVTRKMGPKHVPSRSRGLRMTKVRGVEAVARYVGKLGLELVNDLGKKAKGASVTPWQLLEDAGELRARAKATQGDDRRDLNRAANRRGRTWRTWVDGMKGARWITWSVGLRALAGLGPERSDEQLVADADQLEGAAAAVKARIPNELRKAVLYNRRLVDVLINAADAGLPLGPFVADALGAVEAAVWDSVNEPARLKAWAIQRLTPKPPNVGRLTQSTG